MNNFSEEKLSEFLNLENLNIEEAKRYIEQYFFKCINPVGIFMYMPEQAKFKQFKKEEIKDYILNKKFDIKYDVLVKGVAEKKKFSAFEYLMEQTKNYLPTQVLSKPYTFTENGQRYINLYLGTRREYKPYKEHSQESKIGVEKILKFIDDVWASNVKKAFEYLLSWFARQVTGHKNKTILYVKSIQGSGKSSVSEILCALNRGTFYTTDNPNIIDGWNEQLQGKTLLVLEEMPVASANQWKALSNSLKQKATCDKFEIRERFKNTITTNNILNFIVISNHESIRLESEDRRNFCPDISNKYVGNHEFFNELYSYITNENVLNALYAFFVEWEQAHKDFNEMIIPITNTKKDNINEHLHTFYKFIKSEYLSKKQGINEPFSEMIGKYNAYDDQAVSDIKVSKLLSDININVKTVAIKKGEKRTTTKYVKVSYDELYSIFCKKHWIHDLDGISNDEPVEEIIIDDKLDDLDYGVDTNDVNDLLDLIAEPVTKKSESKKPATKKPATKKTMQAKQVTKNEFTEDEYYDLADALDDYIDAEPISKPIINKNGEESEATKIEDTDIDDVLTLFEDILPKKKTNKSKK